MKLLWQICFMHKIKLMFGVILVFLLGMPAVDVSAQAQSDSVYFKPVNKYLHWSNMPKYYDINDNSIIIAAGEKTDLFISADGWYKANSAPNLTFNADSEFIFNAKITTNLDNKWDGGVLFINYDDGNWAKLCFEKDYKGIKRIVTVVTNGVSDDCNSEIIHDASIYLQIAKKDNVVYFYYSVNNSDWYLVRNFRFPFQKNIKLGFLAQSSTSTTNKVIFSEIHYSPTRISDFWKGK